MEQTLVCVPQHEMWLLKRMILELADSRGVTAVGTGDCKYAPESWTYTCPKRTWHLRQGPYGKHRKHLDVRLISCKYNDNSF